MRLAQVQDAARLARCLLPWLGPAPCLGDEAATDRLLEWPGRDLGFDEGYWDRLARQRLPDLARLPVARRAAETRPTCSSRPLLKRKRPKLLATTPRPCWRAIPPGSRAPSPPICGIIDTSELNPRLVQAAMSDEGTALWHLARRRGFEVGRSPRTLLMIPRP